eukprot:NODE_9501_length_367_cov_4.767296_g8596_i0.p2 GENE.NODE_9501_length_367_cov_4.767296_g8596_i0~~NODE_9501_length_367_cov_4.767296_g8596_i0.p2  ORF type:complete len:95 (-),score=4.19 NODE_9501_length_367_cov_4.767296_g8596_i0:82-342(-)
MESIWLEVNRSATGAWAVYLFRRLLGLSKYSSPTTLQNSFSLIRPFLIFRISFDSSSISFMSAWSHSALRLVDDSFLLDFEANIFS